MARVNSAITIRTTQTPCSPLSVSDSEELRVIVYQGDGGYVALCPSYPGMTGEGPTREDCVADLQRNIEQHLQAQSDGLPES